MDSKPPLRHMQRQTVQGGERKHLFKDHDTLGEERKESCYNEENGFLAAGSDDAGFSVRNARGCGGKRNQGKRIWVLLH